MKPADLATIKNLADGLAKRYGHEPMQHMQPKAGIHPFGHPGGADEPSGVIEHAVKGLDAIATLALADAINNLAKAVASPRTRKASVMLPTGPVEMTITETPDGKRTVVSH